MASLMTSTTVLLRKGGWLDCMMHFWTKQVNSWNWLRNRNPSCRRSFLLGDHSHSRRSERSINRWCPSWWLLIRFDWRCPFFRRACMCCKHRPLYLIRFGRFLPHNQGSQIFLELWPSRCKISEDSQSRHPVYSNKWRLCRNDSMWQTDDAYNLEELFPRSLSCHKSSISRQNGFCWFQLHLWR